MKILAFLQNPYFKPGTSQEIIDIYRTNSDERRRLLASTATGRALTKALGLRLFNIIVWDNANPKHGETRDEQLSADVSHMRRMIEEVRPDLVLCFGQSAKEGFQQAKLSLLFLDHYIPDVAYAPHPMARGSSIKHLEHVARVVHKFIEKHEAHHRF